MAQANESRNPGSTQRVFTRKFPLTAIRIALLFAIAIGIPFCWFSVQGEGWNTPPLLPTFVLYETPYLAALVFLAPATKLKRIAQGAGIAFVGAIASIALEALFFVMAIGTIWDVNPVRFPNLNSLLNTMPAVLAANVCLLIFALLVGKSCWPRFFAGCGVAAAYLALAVCASIAMNVPGSGKQKEAKIWVRRPDQAVHAVLSLTSCLIQREGSRPDDGFPISLAAIRPDWQCDMQYAKAEPIDGYTLRYEPRKDAASGRVTDFRITAIPLKPAVQDPFMNPLMTDRRGVLFFYEEWSWQRGVSTIIRGNHDLNNSALIRLKAHIDEFTKHHSGHPPASLEGLLDVWIGSWQVSDHGTTLSGGGTPSGGVSGYVIHYSAPVLEHSSHFAVSATCQNYGQECIRSYFLDFDGAIHATPEHRAATAQDSLILPCEMGEPCDIGWPVPAPPSIMQVRKASLQHALSSTNLW
jgi:hypothetical protein